MDEIKKIIQLGTEVEGSWKGGDVLVIFEDESIEPIRVNSSELYKVYEEYGLQHGMDISNLTDVAENIPDEDIMIADVQNKEELDAAMAEFNAAKEKAAGAKKKPGTPVTPVPVVVPPTKGTETPERELPPERGATERLNDKVKSKSSGGKKAVAAILAGAAGIGAGVGAAQFISDYLQNRTSYEHNIDDENTDTDENTYDWFTNYVQGSEFASLMGEMDQSDLRRQVAEDAAELVTFFHMQTHKEGNFRLAEDGDVYLDLSIEEATALTVFLNYTDPIELNEILGSYNFDATTITDLVESAMSKLMTYYMNAQEISGVSSIIHDENSRALFERFENDILLFNAMHDTTTSDKLIRDLYYTFVLNGQPNIDNVPASVKFLIGNMMESFQLKENANAEHAILFDQYHGLSFEDEMCYFVENYVLRQPGGYSSLSEEQKQLYRDTYASSLIESGTTLVDMFSNGIVMNEDNSTQEQRDATTSITDVINMSGYCNTAYQQLSEAIANRYAMLDTNDNRPGLDRIFNAAQTLFSTYDNYFGYLNGKSDQIAVLINNRRHTAYNNSLDSFSGLTQGGIDDFINETGTPTGENTNTTTEEVEYDDLTPEEQTQVEEQKNLEEAEYIISNINADSGKAATDYINSTQYNFNPGTVTNDFNGEVYELNPMGFLSGVAFMYAFGGGAPTAQDSQIQAAASAAADNYLNSISKEHQDAIATKMGTSWENARAQLKTTYINGYTSQMEQFISLAISDGQRMRELTDQEKAFVDEQNEKAEQDTNSQDQQETPGNNDDQPTEGEVTLPVPGPNGEILEPEVNPNENETGDDNLDIQTGEGEQPYDGEYTEDPEYNNSTSEENTQSNGIEDPQVEPNIPEGPSLEDPNIVENTADGEVPYAGGEYYEQDPQPEQVEQNTATNGEEVVNEAAPEAPTVAEETTTQEAPVESEPVVESQPAVEAPAVVEQAAAAPEVQAPVQQQSSSIPNEVIQQAVDAVMNETFAQQDNVEAEAVKTM